MADFLLHRLSKAYGAFCPVCLFFALTCSVAFLLAGRLRWQGPPVWQAFLEHQREQCLLRDAVIGRLIERIHHEVPEARVCGLVEVERL